MLVKSYHVEPPRYNIPDTVVVDLIKDSLDRLILDDIPLKNFKDKPLKEIAAIALAEYKAYHFDFVSALVQEYEKRKSKDDCVQWSSGRKCRKNGTD